MFHLIDIVSIWLAGMCISRSDPNLLQANQAATGTAAQSPFVIVIHTSGIKTLDHIVNAVILTSAFSSGNEFLYASSRALFMLSQQGQAPWFFGKLLSNGVPIWSVLFNAMFALLAYLNCGQGGATDAFNWLSNITALGSMITWTGIGYAHIRFYKGKSNTSMPAPLLVNPHFTRYAKARPFTRRASFPYLHHAIRSICCRNMFLHHYIVSSLTIPFCFLFPADIPLLSASMDGLRSYMASLRPQTSSHHISIFRAFYPASSQLILLLIYALNYSFFFLLFAGWKIVKKTKWVKLDEMDVYVSLSGRLSFSSHMKLNLPLFPSLQDYTLRGWLGCEGHSARVTRSSRFYLFYDIYSFGTLVCSNIGFGSTIMTLLTSLTSSPSLTSKAYFRPRCRLLAIC